MPMPLQVAVIVAGRHNKAHNHLVRDFLQYNQPWPNAYELYNVQKDLQKDPNAGGTFYGVNSLNISVAQSVLRNANFGGLVASHLEVDAMSKTAFGKVFECAAGWHRADACGRAYVEGLNEVKDNAGSHKFNAELFALNECKDQTAVCQMLNDANVWLEADPAWVDLRRCTAARKTLHI